MPGKIKASVLFSEQRADCIKVYGLKRREVFSGAMNSPIVSMFLKVISWVLQEMGNYIWAPIELCFYCYERCFQLTLLLGLADCVSAFLQRLVISL